MRRRPRAAAGGQATVEVALALPVLLVALLLVVQVTLVARAQILVVHAAREGARVAAVDPRTGAAARAARGAPGLRVDRLRVTATPAGGPDATVAVTVRYRVPTDVPLVGLLLDDPELVATVTMRAEETR